MLELSGAQLQSYSYEFYVRIKSAYNISSSSTISSDTVDGTFTLADQRGSLLDCGSHSKVTVDSLKLLFIQVGGQQVQYSFGTNEFQLKFLDQWRHLTFSYQNGTDSTNGGTKIYPMRIFIDGVLSAQFNFSIGISNELFTISRDLCFIGNAQPSLQTIGTALNADMKFLLVSQLPRIANFQDEIYHKYPQPDRGALVLYFKLDEQNTFSQDFYWNNAVSDFANKGTTWINSNQKEQLCECYSQPQSYLQLKKGTSLSYGITLQEIDDVVISGSMIDLWLNIQGNLDDGATSSKTVKTIIQADKMIRLMTLGKQLMVQVGNSTANYTITNATLYFNKWVYLAVAVYPNSTADVFRNGVRVGSFSYVGKVSNQQVIQVKHEITALLGRLRLIKNITRIPNLLSFVSDSYLTGSLDSYSALQFTSQVKSYNSSFLTSFVVFDFLASDLNFSNQSYSASTKQYSGSYLWSSTTYSTQSAVQTQSQIYRFVFENAMFAFDNNMCGRDGLWVNSYNDSSSGEDFGACAEPKMLKTFSSSDNTAGTQAKVFQGLIRSVYQEMTLSLWFNYQRNKNSASSVLMSVLQQYNLEDRFRAEIYFNSSSNFDNMGIGSFDQGDGFIMFNSSLSQNQWLHITWQCRQSSNLAQAILYSYSSRTSKTLSSNGSIRQPNTVKSKTYLGGDSNGQRRFLGTMKELKIWFSYQTPAEINQQRNILLKDYTADPNLMHYYRFDGDNSFTSIQDLLQLNQSTAYDLSISSSLLPIQTPIRYFPDSNLPTLTFCQYETFLTSSYYCAFQSEFSMNLIYYQDLDADQLWIVSNAIFYNNDSVDYYQQFSLIQFDVTDSAYLQRQQQLFYYKDIAAFNISSYKLSKQYRYYVNLTIGNLMYPTRQRTQQVIIDNSCPSFSFNSYNPADQTVLFYIQPSQNFTVDIINKTQCLFQSFYVPSVHNYSWQLMSAQGNSSSIQKIFNFSYSPSNMNLTLVPLQSVPNGLILTLNISLVFKNSLLNTSSQLQTLWQTVNIKFTQDNVALILSSDYYRVMKGDDLNINAGSSFILVPPYQQRDVQFSLNCPSTLFKSSSIYSDLCYMDIYGRFRINANSIATQMSVETNVLYTFTVTGSVKLNASLYTSKSFIVQFVSLIDSTSNCPNITLDSIINITTLTNSTKVFPKYQLTCDRGSYISQFEIQQLHYSLNLSNVSYFKNIVQQTILSQTSNASSIDQDQMRQMITQQLSQVNESDPMISKVLDLQNNYTWAYFSTDSRYNMQIGEKIQMNISYVLSSPELGGSTQAAMVSTLFQRIPTDFVQRLVTNNYTFVYQWNETILLDMLNTYDPQDPGVVLNFLWQCPRPTSNSDI